MKRVPYILLRREEKEPFLRSSLACLYARRFGIDAILAVLAAVQFGYAMHCVIVPVSQVSVQCFSDCEFGHHVFALYCAWGS